MKKYRNKPCFCGSLEKYKNCCENKGVDWLTLQGDKLSRHLRVRGKNLHFLHVLKETLNLSGHEYDSVESLLDAVRRNLNEDAIVRIYSSIMKLWPDYNDCVRALSEERNEFSGLYLGEYLYKPISKMLNRHALYNEKIILIDPFLDPRTVRDKYNPIVNPSAFILVSYHFIVMWLLLEEWIRKGIVVVIRSLGDFDITLRKQCMLKSEARSDSVPELREILKNVGVDGELKTYGMEMMISIIPENALEREVDRLGLSGRLSMEDIREMRRSSLYAIDVQGKDQLTYFTSGETYDMGKLLCAATGSYIITNSHYRYTELQGDSKIGLPESCEWEEFGYVFGNVKLNALDGVGLNGLLKLREYGLLKSTRDFLRKSWYSSSANSGNPSAGAVNMSAELNDKIHEAASEWNHIQRIVKDVVFRDTFVATTIGLISGAAAIIPVLGASVDIMYHMREKALREESFLTYRPAGLFFEEVRKKVL